MTLINMQTIKVDGSGGISSLVFLEDGKRLLSGGQDGMIRQWRTEDGTEVGEAMKARTCVRAIALSSDRKWIISGEHSGATVWSRYTRQNALTVNEHNDWVTAVDVSPDSTRFVTGGMDRRVSIWDILTGVRLVGPLYHDSNLTAVKFSPNGDCIATTTWTAQSLRIYRVHTGELLKTFTLASIPTEPIAWSSDSLRIFAISSNFIRQIFIETGTLEWIVPGGLPHSLPRDSRFLAYFIGNSLIFWDTYSGERFGPVFDQPGGRVRSIALSPDNNYLATGRNDGTITLRNFHDFIPITNDAHHGRTVVQHPPLEIDALRSELRALGSRVDELTKTCLPSNDFTRLEVQTLPSHVGDGTYCIKSIIADVYLTCPQDSAITVVVQRLDPSNQLAQRWFISHTGNGIYTIEGRKGDAKVRLDVGRDNELVCVSDGGTNWTIDSRGIGNAGDATAIHLMQRPLQASIMLRQNTPNQHWILEPVLDEDMPVAESADNLYTLYGACEYI